MQKPHATPLPGAKESAIGNTIRFLYDSDQLVKDYRRKYGNTFVLHLLFGDLVIFTHPDEIKEFFALRIEYHESYVKEILSPLVGPESIFLVSGDKHRHYRKILTPFLHGASLPALATPIQQRTHAHLQQLPVGVPFKMMDVMRGLLIEVMIEMSFGNLAQERVRHYHGMMEEIDAHNSTVIFFLAPLRRLFCGLGPWRAMDQRRQRMSAMIHQDIKARRQSGPGGADVLSKLVELGDEVSDAIIHDQLMSLLFAGYETTSVALSWAFFWIYHTPHCLQRVLAEIATLGSNPLPTAYADLTYLEAVCLEVLRISPVLNLIARRIVLPCQVGAWQLTPGMAAAISVTEVHHAEEIYPAPQLFKPERFLDKKPHPSEFLAFGGGVRKCLGATMALYEMKIVLGTALGNYDFQLLAQTIPQRKLHGVTIYPSNRIPMMMKQRYMAVGK